MVRYADDFVILCRTREEAEAALEDVRAWVSENGLALHPEKTHVGDCRQPGAYNAQAVVAAGSLLVVAADVFQARLLMV